MLSAGGFAPGWMEGITEIMTLPVYPVFLHLAGQPVLIVGGGKVALRKARGLMESQADITVVSPVFAAELAPLPNVVLRREKYQSSHINGPDVPQWRLVFAATDDPAVNRQVAADARKRNILCCRCDASEEGDFSNGSVWRKEPVVVAVSTSGASPVLAAKIAQTLVQTLDPSLVEHAALMDSWRARVLAEIADEQARATVLRQLGGDEMLRVLHSGGAVAARNLFESYLTAAKSGPPGAGEKTTAPD